MKNLRIQIFVQIQRVSTCLDEVRLLCPNFMSRSQGQITRLTKQKQQNIQPSIRKSISHWSQKDNTYKSYIQNRPDFIFSLILNSVKPFDETCWWVPELSFPSIPELHCSWWCDVESKLWKTLGMSAESGKIRQRGTRLLPLVHWRGNTYFADRGVKQDRLAAF